MQKQHKKIGLGSLSLLLLILGILFSFSFGSQAAFGDHILTFLGLKPWSNGETGVHYTVFYSLILYIPAMFFGYKFRNDWGAKTGRILSTIMGSVILLLIPFMLM